MSFFEPNQFAQLTTAEVAWVEKAAIVGLPSVSNELKVFRVNSAGTNFELATPSGGSGFTLLATASPVNGTNQSFVFSQKPTYVIADGVWYTENNGWSWNSGTLTVVMGITPQTGIFAFV